MCLERIGELHQRGHGRVEAKSFVVFGHFSNRLVLAPAKYRARSIRSSDLERVWRVDQTPDVLEETHRTGDGGVRPFDVLVGRTDEHLVDAGRVGTIPGSEVVGRHAIAL